jgi:hypothetical protein
MISKGEHTDVPRLPLLRPWTLRGLGLVLCGSSLFAAAACTDAGSDPRCYTAATSGGIPIKAYVGDRACHAFKPPERMDGIWLNEFEGSRFFREASTLPEINARTEDVWMEIDEQTQLPAGLDALGDGHAYRVAIIGREAKRARRPPKGYGHMGAFTGLVVVDRIVSATDLGSPPELR